MAPKGHNQEAPCEADEVEVSVDEAKSKWLVRIVVGERSGEAVLRRGGKMRTTRRWRSAAMKDAAG